MHTVHIYAARIVLIQNIPQLIKMARNGRSQAAFARELGVQQPTLSRYEKGEANPKAHVIEKCMRLVHWADQIPAPTVDELANKIKVQLGRNDQAQLRMALSNLIDELAAERTMKQSKGSMLNQAK